MRVIATRISMAVLIALAGVLAISLSAHTQQPSAAERDARFQMMLRQVIEQAPYRFEGLRGRVFGGQWVSTLAANPPDLAPYELGTMRVWSGEVERLSVNEHVIALRAPGADRDAAARDRLWNFVQRNLDAVAPGWSRLGLYNANDTWSVPRCAGGLLSVTVRRPESADELHVIVRTLGKPRAACVRGLGGASWRTGAPATGDGSLHLTGRLLARFPEIGPHVRGIAGELVERFDRLKGEPLDPSGDSRFWRSRTRPLDLSPFVYQRASVRQASDYREHYSIYRLEDSDEDAFWTAFFTARNGIHVGIPSAWNRSSIDVEGDTWSRNCPGDARMSVHLHPEPEMREIGISVQVSGRPTCALAGW